MNVFNKIILVILLLFFIIISSLSIVNEFAGFFKWSDIAHKIFNPGINISPYISTLALLFVIVVCILLLLLEFYRRKTRIAKVYNVESGTAMITIDTIAHQVKDAVLKVEGIKSLGIDISQKSGGIIIEMNVEMSQKANIPEKMTEIIKIARDVSLNRLNVKVVDTRLTITNLVPDEKAPSRPFGAADKSAASPVIQYVEDQKVLQDRAQPAQQPHPENTKVQEQYGEKTAASNTGPGTESNAINIEYNDDEINESDDSGNIS